jgi:hypothetical protein
MFLCQPRDLLPTYADPIDDLAVLRNALSGIRKPSSLSRAQSKLTELRRLGAAKREHHRAICAEISQQATTIGGSTAVSRLAPNASPVDLRRLEAEIKSLDTQISAAKRQLQAERDAWAPTVRSNIKRHRSAIACDVIAAVELLADADMRSRIIHDYFAQNGLELHPAVNLPVLDYLLPAMRKIAENG